jgi:FkbM family methyltransferase
MLRRSLQVGAGIVGVLLVVLVVGGSTTLDSLRPPTGYRRTVVELVRPGLVPLESIQGRKSDFVVDFYGFRYRGNTGNLIDAHVFYYGAFEKSELYFIRDTVTALGPDTVLVDVGANVGQHAVFASKYAKEVHAIEPYPLVLPRLRGIVEENRINNIVVHPVGLGATEAELPFFAPPPDNLGYASFVPGFVTGVKDAELKLRIVAGDPYFSQAAITRVDFMKMDIEGYEKPALTGLRATLRRDRPIVLMELSINPSFPDLFKSLDDLKAAYPENYEFFTFDARDPLSGAYRLAPFQPSFDRNDQFNIVARPIEKADKTPMMSEGDSASNP